MSLIQLSVHNLRNIASVKLSLHPQCNIFVGPNGSGKTSLLEAIYLLGSGHSFRTREISPLISTGEHALTVFSRTIGEETISIQKRTSGSTQVKLNSLPCHNSSELARFLPCQVFYQDIFHIIDAGPSVRRSVLDWGLFHVKQSYHAIWKNYRRVLKQRNALLRQKAKQKDFLSWDTMLVELAIELDKCRRDYFEEWSIAFQRVLNELTDLSCTLNYYKGWDRKESGKDLKTILTEQFSMDSHRQYTHYGAHQADIILNCIGLKPKQSLSRGQQKIILIALKLAQTDLLSSKCLYLFDDIMAELDTLHQNRLITYLSQLNGQKFLTTIEPSFLSSLRIDDYTLFSLDNGKVNLNVSRETNLVES